MMTQKLISLITAGLLAATLAGCTSFAPVYGDQAGSNNLASARFNYAPAESRLDQIIINRLKVAFPGEARPGDPVLDIDVRISSPQGSMSDAFAVARPVNVRVEATVNITQNGETLFQTTRFADTAYQSGKLAPTNISSRMSAEETAARSAAEALRAAILAGYSR